MMRLAALALAAAVLAGCARPVPIDRPAPAWRAVATDHDRDRLRDWRASFVKALAAARKSGHGPAIDSDPALFNPDSALGSPAIPNGRYRCRVTKLGAQSEGMLDFIAYPAFPCIVGSDGGLQRLDKLGGSQRQVGMIYPNDAVSNVFLGTLVLGDESRAMLYGQDRARDVAGLVQRIGPARWRLVMPRPYFESVTDVLDLTPQPAE